MRFGKRREARIAELTHEVERLRRDPARVIGQHVLDEAQNRADSDVDLPAAIDAQTDEAISTWAARKIRGLVSTGVARAVEAEKRRLRAMAAREAELQIEHARQEFRHSPDAAAYLADKTAELRETELPEMIAEEHNTLHAKALEDLRDEAVIMAPGMFLESDPRSDKEYSKKRAAELREITKVSRVFEFAMLMEGDEVEIALTAEGKGGEQLTGYYRYSSYQKTELIERKLLLRYSGDADAFLLIKDSEGDEGIHPMTPVHLFSEDPTDGAEQIDGLVKARPVAVTSPSGDLLVDNSLEVWFADLNGFRVLS